MYDYSCPGKQIKPVVYFLAPGVFHRHLVTGKFFLQHFSKCNDNVSADVTKVKNSIFMM